MICAIHQPNLVPWYPFFEKMAAADVFVILTDCQFEKGGYQNRFNAQGQWYTMPVYRGLDSILHKRYVSPHESWARIVNRISMVNNEWANWLIKLRPMVNDRLWLTNTRIIEYLASAFGIKTEIVESHKVCKPDALCGSTTRLINACKAVQCTEYLSGPSGAKYLNEDLMRRNGITVNYTRPSRRKVSALEVLCGS